MLAVATSGRNQKHTADRLTDSASTSAQLQKRTSLAVGLAGLCVSVNASRRVYTGTHPPHFPLESLLPVEQVSGKTLG